MSNNYDEYKWNKWSGAVGQASAKQIAELTGKPYNEIPPLRIPRGIKRTNTVKAKTPKPKTPKPKTPKTPINIKMLNQLAAFQKTTSTGTTKKKRIF